MKKKCLIILPRNLFPVVGGYAIKTINVVKILCSHYEVKIIIIADTPIAEEEKLFYETYTKDYRYFYFPKMRFLLKAIWGIFKKKPLQCSYYSFNQVSKIVKESGNDCDIIVSTLIRTAPYLDLFGKDVIKVIDMVDSIGLNYTRSAQNTSSLFWRFIYMIEAKRLMRYEQESIVNASVTWFVNQSEASYWSKYGNVIWTPMPIKEFIFRYDQKNVTYNNSVAFFGKMDYQPNIDAALWYYDNVHKKMRNPPSLIIVGGSPTKDILDLAKNNNDIVVTGFLDDPYLILNSVKAIVAPMQTGGGMQNKVLETMALGCVNILSSLAASPIIGAKDGKHLIIANTTEDYINAFSNLNNEYAKEIGCNAKELVSGYYRYNKYRDILIDSIESI